MGQQFLNNWAYTLTAGITDVATTINVGTVGATLLASASATNPYYLTIDDDVNLEIVLVTAANGGNGDLTVTRGQDGTSGSAFSSGALVEMRTTAQILKDLQNLPPTHADNAVPRADGANTQKMQTSGLVIDDNNALSGHGAKINAQTGTTYTLAASDNGKIVTLDNAADIALILPQQSTTPLAEGFQCAIVQKGAGQVTVAKEGTDTILSEDSYLKLTKQGSIGTVVLMTAGTPNAWFLAGSLSA